MADRFEKGVLEKLVEQDLPELPSKPSQAVGRPSKVSLQRAQKSLSDKQLAFAVWSAQPEAYRSPRTQGELAQQLGVSDPTLWRWSKNPKVIAAIRWMVLHHAGKPDRVSTIIDMLYEAAQNESYSINQRMDAAREFLNAVGVKQMWKNPTPELLTVKDVSEIPLDELSDEEVWELYLERSQEGGELPQGSVDDSEVVEAEVVDE